MLIRLFISLLVNTGGVTFFDKKKKGEIPSFSSVGVLPGLLVEASKSGSVGTVRQTGYLYHIAGMGSMYILAASQV